MSIFRVSYVLVVTLLAMLFLFQHAIESYWQQVYHSESPITQIQSQGYISLPMASAPVAPLPDLTSDRRLTNAAYFSLSRAYPATRHVQPLLAYLGLTPADYYFAGDSLLVNYHREREAAILQALLPRSSLAPDIVTPLSDKLRHFHVQYKALKDYAAQHRSDALIAAQLTIDPLARLRTATLRRHLPIRPASAAMQTAAVVPPAAEPIYLHQGDKFFYVGDSMMQGVAPWVKRSLYRQYKLEGLNLSKQSTGLSYAKAFDWPKVVEETLANDQAIKVMVIFLGPNDPWHLKLPDRRDALKYRSPEWEAEYRQRIARILTAAQTHSVQVIWLGVPCMLKNKLHQDMLYLNTLYQSEVEKFAGHFIPTSELLGCSDAKYSNVIRTSKGNVKVRIDDGIHFTQRGQTLLADRIIAELNFETMDQEVTRE